MVNTSEVAPKLERLMAIRHCGFIKACRLLLIISIMAIPSYAQAQRFFLGPVVLNPYLTLRQTYNDNIFSTKSDTKEDFITSAFLGLNAKMPYETHMFTIGGYYGYSRYNDLTDISDYHAKLIGEAKFQFELSKAEIKNTFLSSFVQQEIEGEGEKTAVGERFNYDEFSLTYKKTLTSYFLGRAGYRLTAVDYENSEKPDLENYVTNVLDMGLGYTLTPQIDLFLDVYGSNTNFSHRNRDKDNKSGALTGSLEGKIGPLTTGRISLGVRHTDYQARDDFTGFISSTELEHRLTPLTTVNLGFTSEEVYSSYENNNYFWHIGADLSISHRLTRTLTAYLTGGYYRNIYPEKSAVINDERKDDIYYIAPKVSYSILDWLNTELLYRFYRRDSNIDVEDFDQNKVVLFLNISL